MKILKQLRTAKGFETFTCLTFNVSIPWFETLLVHQLRRRGTRRFLIFADRGQLSRSLMDAARSSSLLGRGYIVHGVSSRVRFHPKLYLLTGSAGARLYVGSGNLSRGGLDRNLEVFERWDVEPGRGDWPQPFLTAQQILETRVTELGDEAQFEREHLDLAFANMQRATSYPSRVLASPPSLLEQVPEVPSDCKHLRLVAPFFDAEGEAVAALAKRLWAQRLTVLTHLGMTNLTRRAVEQIQAGGGEVVRILGDRPVHAKLVHAEGEGWAIGVVGSANISRAAWYGHNHELVVMREGAEAAEVGALVDELEAAPLTDDDLALLDALEAARDDDGGDDDDEAAASGPVLSHVRWGTKHRVEFSVARGGPATAIELSDRHGCLLLELKTMATQVTAPSELRRGEVCLARAWLGERPGPWAVVHDVEELRERSSPPSPERRALEELLGAQSFDPEAAIALLEVFADVMSNRSQRVAEAKRRAREEAPNGGDEPAKLVGLGDFAAPETRSPGRLRISDGLSLLSARTMNRLLFGDEEFLDGAGTPASDGESGLEEDDLVDDLSDHAFRTAHSQLDDLDPQERHQRRLAFSKLCERARTSYLLQLSAARSRRAERLLEDLVILAAPLHYMARSGELSAIGLRRELAILLRAFLGGRTSPFIAAVDRLDVDQRDELWEETPVLLVVVLLVYNTCLADLHCSRASRARPVFPDARPLLWLRWLLDRVSPDRLESFIESCRDFIPKLRAGRIFWLADMWQPHSLEAPFAEFVRDLVADAHALRTITAQLQATDYSSSLRHGEDDDELLVLDEFGLVGIGWAEFPFAVIRVGAFDEAEAFLSHNAKMLRLPQGRVVLLSRLWDAADRGAELDLDGLDVLDRLGG